MTKPERASTGIKDTVASYSFPNERDGVRSGLPVAGAATLLPVGDRAISG
jgi:hypothetical protein